jgi:hypothetical protein
VLEKSAPIFRPPVPPGLDVTIILLRENTGSCTARHSGEAVDGQVAARRRGLQSLAFGVPHALEERNLAVVVGVDADAEVHFPRILVGDEGFGDAEDRIGRRHGQRGERGG